MTIRRSLALACALVLMAMTLAACGGSDDADDTTATTTGTTAAATTEATTGTTTAATTTAATTATTAATETTAGGGGDAAEFTVTVQSLKYDVEEIRVKAGQEVTITVNDLDTTSDDPHNFHVRAGDLNFFTNILAAPNTQTLTFSIDTPGTYEFFCDTHPQDLRGVFVVEP